MSGFGRKITAAAIAMSLCAGSTAAIAAAPPATVAATQTASTQASPWLALSAMTTSSSALSTAAAAQGYDDDGPGLPPIAPLVVILATIAAMVYILASDNDHGGFHIRPISPA